MGEEVLRKMRTRQLYFESERETVGICGALHEERKLEDFETNRIQWMQDE